MLADLLCGVCQRDMTMLKLISWHHAGRYCHLSEEKDAHAAIEQYARRYLDAQSEQFAGVSPLVG